MALTLPTSDLARFTAVGPELVTLAYLATQKQGLSLATIQQRLKKLVPATVVDTAVSALIDRDLVRQEKTVTLTGEGQQEARQVLGSDASQPWDVIRGRRLPLLALGLDPDQADVKRRYAKADALKAAAIAVAYGLPKEAMAGAKAVSSELVWQILRSGLADVVGRGPFPEIEKPGVVERVLLAGLAGGKAKSVPEAINALAAKALGVPKMDSDLLRERLVVIGVSLAGAESPLDAAAGSGRSVTKGGDSFATRVRDVALTLSTPPFQGRVAIAQVYDAYGRVHPDAASLKSFKERLVQAAKAREIELGRLDLPERMSKELRQRSETAWGLDEVHFVITEWK
ncbi:MAG: hypothetical protein J0I57_03840 [Hyphomicrobium sp.]|nr:hypothetical protein [Hyphomicrobium sp.]